MKTFLTDITGSGYTFNKATSQVTLTGIDTLALNQVLAVVNTTRGITICDCTIPSLKVASIAANVITLSYDTSSQADTDKLLIVLDYAGVSGSLTDAELRASAVPVSGSFFQATQPISAVALPLPTGAATSAKQDTAIASLGTDITTPTAMPTGGVGIRGWVSAIWTKLNGTIGVTGTFWQATQPVSAASLPLPSGAAIAANQQTDALTNTQLRASAVPVSGPLTDAQIRATALPVSGAFYQATQPVSASSLPLPSGAATAANQQTDALTDTQLRATPVPVSGTVSTGLTQPLTDAQIRASALPISAATLPLPSGAATGAKQDTGNTSLSTIAGKDFATQTTLAAIAADLPSSLGAKTGANSFSVVPNSDTPFPVSDNSGSLTVDAPVATPVFVRLSDGASAISTLPVSAASLPLPSGAATETTLSAANTKLPASVGEKAAASSFPVTLSTDNLSDLYVTGQSAQTATVNNILTAASGTAATDVSQYRSFAIQVVSTGTSGTFIFEGSNDNSNFQAIPVYNQALVVRVPIITAITATSSQFIYEGSCNFRYLRLRIATLIGGGSIQAFSTFLQVPLGTASQIVSQGTAANLLATVSAAANWSSNVAQVAGVAPAAHSAAATAAPLPAGGKVVPTTIATVDATLVAADACNVGMTTGYQNIIKPFGTAELDWVANVAFTPTVWASAATPTILRAASGTASVRTYLAGMCLQSDALGAALSLWILDGAVAVTSVTIATPGVFTNSGTNDFKAGDAVIFQSLGTITGITANTVYYVTATTLAATTFTVATTIGGTALQITGSTSACTVYRVLSQTRLQTAALTPNLITFPNPLRTAANVALSVIASSTQTGTVYVSPTGYYGF